MRVKVGPLDGSRKNWLLYNARPVQGTADWADVKEGTSLLWFDGVDAWWLQTQEDLVALLYDPAYTPPEAPDPSAGKGSRKKQPPAIFFNMATVKVQAELREPLP